MSEKDTTYNGYANYETWNVALWLSNDQGSDKMCREMVAEAGSVRDGAKAIQDYVEESNPLAGDASMFSDILSAALHSVDWDEVAAAFKPDEWGDNDEAPEDDPDDEPDEDEDGDIDIEASNHTAPEDFDLAHHGVGDIYAYHSVYGPGPINNSTGPWYWLRTADFDYDWRNDHNVYPRE